MQCAAARPSAAPVGGRRTAHAQSSALQRHAAAPRRVAVRAATEEKEEYDLNQKIDTGKLIDSAGAGRSMFSPGWLTQLNQLWGGKSNVPVANAKPEDIQDLLGGALFKALYKWMLESGPVYLLPTGPVSSFLVISDPEAAKHVLRASDNPNRPIYEKGLVAEVSKFLFGEGFAISGGEQWRVRRKAVGPALHRGYLEVMLDRVFGESALHLNKKLEVAAASGEAIDMEACFSQLTLDVIGKAVFNYDFNSLNKNTPVIQAVYTALKETETRATDLLPYWKFPIINLFVPRQQKAAAAVQLIRETTEELIAKCKAITFLQHCSHTHFEMFLYCNHRETTEELIAKCKAMVDAEEAAQFEEGYINEADPSVLRFLIASREEVDSVQLRDDLLSMLVAGHETTGSVLTWTVDLLARHPDKLRKAQEEVDRVLGDRSKPNMEEYMNLKYVMRCVNESMRLYPHPPVLLRRAIVEDELPGGFTVPRGQDVMISVYNIHHSPAVWERPDDFEPERFPLDGPVPSEQNTDYKYIPFSGGPRKCVGDQFALMEAVVALAVILKEYDFAPKPGHDPGMTTGATIHTKNGLYMNVSKRQKGSSNAQPAAAAAVGAA
ncbi:carotene epsilon- chloroplastic isoform A [Chlorella sorokiniana]|uniref:Carotene epsilon-chloroplastic isoform A n=1 Tax=Chlorella sorokiniana TaxID=3076 RepID=A0A2P6TIE5_CHLSO|nr:carotene epsilon- chloroplastic isoform A [Chlorella sorokiniana]|eukprot:PRW34039.1 carotene epsilon- chloroplastic isoform A [Chlorella sorokiniana]